MLQAWIYWILLSLVPTAPWPIDYQQISLDMARESSEHPLYGSDSAYQTAATLIDIAYQESRFNIAARGDCKRGLPKTDANCQSFGLYQISKAHARPIQLLAADTATVHARALLARSLQICARRPPEERFAWYAAGGNGCSSEGFRKSRHRYAFAEKILREHPLPDEAHP